jgi:hypothetical protein
MVKLFERIDPAKLDVDAFEWMCAGNNDWKDVLLAGQDYCRLDRPADMEKCRGHAPQMPPIGYRFLVPPDAATAPPAANNKTV